MFPKILKLHLFCFFRWLPAEALKLEALAASAFGAGFGGSVWALIETEKAEKFSKDWAESYRKKFPKCAEESQFRTMKPGPGSFLL